MDFDSFEFSRAPLSKLIEDEHRFFSDRQIFFDGTVRACSPEQTLARVSPHAAQLGITRIAHVGGLDSLGIPVTICYRPNSRHLSSGQGKGFTQALADASAIMECIEGYHIEQPKSPSLRGRYLDLCERYRLADPRQLSPGYFTCRDLERYVFDWHTATNLIDWDTVYLPVCLAQLDFSRHVPEVNVLSLTSNGLASGNLLTEAICHGIMEVVERHCLATFNRSSQRQKDNRRVDLASISSGAVIGAIERFHNANHDVVLWDMTSDLRIPSINCVVIDKDPQSPLGYHGGSGTHYQKDIAVMRALAEAAQSRAVWISGSRDDLFPERYSSQAVRKAARTHLDSVESSSPPGQFDFGLTPSIPTPESFNATLVWLCDRLRQNGFGQVLVMNHTMPDLNIPVVQVVIPGMVVRHDR